MCVSNMHYVRYQVYNYVCAAHKVLEPRNVLCYVLFNETHKGHPMAFIQTEITAEAVIDAMNEDVGFALEIWREIAEGLNKGLLLDNTLDMLRGTELQDCVFISQMVKMIPDFLADHIDHETNKE